MNLKGFINNPVVYLPKFTDWINDKIVFWHADLGSNILAQNAPRGVNVRRSLAVSTAEPRTDVGRKENKFFFTGMTRVNIIGLFQKVGNAYFVEKKHVSLFDCERFKTSYSTTRFRFVMNNGCVGGT